MNLAILIVLFFGCVRNVFSKKFFYAIVSLTISIVFYSQDANADQCFSLLSPITLGNKITGKIEIDRICQSDVKRLMNLPIYGVINDNGEGIEIGGKRYKTCNDVFDNNSSENQHDRAMESIYNSKCELFEKFKSKEIKIPKRTYLEKFTLSSLEKIPSTLFISYGFITDEQYQNFKKSKESNQTLRDLLRNGEIKNYKSNKASISFEFKDNWYSIKEILRADMNNDGIEDAFVTLNSGIKDASYTSNINLVLIKESDSDIIHELKISSPCKKVEPQDLHKCLQKSFKNKN